MRLCLSLGYQSLRHFRACFPSEELPLWLAYANTEGLPESRIEAAVSLAGYYSQPSGKIKFKDFIPKFKSSEKLSDIATNAVLRNWARAQNHSFNKVKANGKR